MHILLIPSEGFVPADNRLEGIFQYHQAAILKDAGYRVGALSVRLSFSVPMILKGCFFKLIGRKAGNATDGLSVFTLLRLGLDKIFVPEKFITAETLHGICVYRIDALYRRRPANNKNHVSWIKAGLICFEEYVKSQGRPDLIHAHDAIYAGMLAERIHAKQGIKYIITEHSSSYALGTTDKSILARVRKAHASAAGLFAVSQPFAKLLNQMFSFERFRCLPNVLDQQLENAPYEPVKSRSKNFRFLHIAVFKPVKDQQTLLRAFKTVCTKKPAVELYIGGDGELETELKQLAVILELQNNVRFLGRLTRSEVISEIKNCDSFVLSSKYETFGLVTVEAMLFGKPVVVTRCGVAEEIVDEKIGFVVDTGDEDGLADAMLTMMEKASTFDAGYIRNFTVNNFGRERFLQALNAIYKEIV